MLYSKNFTQVSYSRNSDGYDCKTVTTISGKKKIVEFFVDKNRDGVYNTSELVYETYYIDLNGDGYFGLHENVAYRNYSKKEDVDKNKEISKKCDISFTTKQENIINRDKNKSLLERLGELLF